MRNFPVSGIKPHPLLIKAYVIIKKSACIANRMCGKLNGKITEAIVKSCNEVLNGEFNEHFVIDVFQAGAGTSFNMNVNEVIANRALEIMRR